VRTNVVSCSSSNWLAVKLPSVNCLILKTISSAFASSSTSGMLRGITARTISLSGPLNLHVPGYCSESPRNEIAEPSLDKVFRGQWHTANGSELSCHAEPCMGVPWKPECPAPQVSSSEMILPPKPLLVFATLVFANIEGGEKKGGECFEHSPR
jgi:hypothetical protein